MRRVKQEDGLLCHRSFFPCFMQCTQKKTVRLHLALCASRPVMPGLSCAKAQATLDMPSPTMRATPRLRAARVLPFVCLCVRPPAL